jgi:hypothetical protein
MKGWRAEDRREASMVNEPPRLKSPGDRLGSKDALFQFDDSLMKRQ